MRRALPWGWGAALVHCSILLLLCALIPTQQQVCKRLPTEHVSRVRR